MTESSVCHCRHTFQTFLDPHTKSFPIHPLANETFSSIASLPIELLIDIFTLIFEGLGAIDTDKLDETRFAVSFTCRAWREVFYATPQFWMSIVITESLDNKRTVCQTCRYRRLFASLARSGPMPIKLDVRSRTVRSSPSLLSAYAPRLKRLILNNAANSDWIAQMQNVELPKLVELVHGGPLDRVYTLNTPALKLLINIGPLLTFAQTSFPPLQDMIAVSPDRAFYPLIQLAAATLRELTLVTPQFHVVPTTPFTLPNLAHLNLQGKIRFDLFQTLDMPNLISLCLTDWQTDFEFNREPRLEPCLPLPSLQGIVSCEGANHVGSCSRHFVQLLRASPNLFALILTNGKHKDDMAVVPSYPGVVRIPYRPDEFIRALKEPDTCPHLETFVHQVLHEVHLPDLAQIASVKMELETLSVHAVGTCGLSRWDVRGHLAALKDQVGELLLPCSVHNRAAIPFGDIEESRSHWPNWKRVD